jgi:hypothetical protein
VRAVRAGIWKPSANGPWNLGRWSIPVNVIALLWIAFITVLFVLPPNTLTGYIFGGTLGRAADFLRGGGARKVQGAVGQARSEEELLRLEAEYEAQS